ncbi:Uncharacterised protein [Myroides odoratimimus]|uniref:Uncharacterized protein n=2 Tax=Myroides odoratimimus TaxID=76832 RepID=A0ABN0E8B8_9FLAO|nr:hypothetical protein HMPREF9712_02539 [Myroides odoratimimus CCUG 10230]EHO13467.1 hypothetical protein HMPREF9715_01341 [Myroides odoratimimus CIP 101113]STZ47989.1 Uncharacterised protein [Myroides odoratimimus]
MIDSNMLINDFKALIEERLTYAVLSIISFEEYKVLCMLFSQN